MFSRQGGSEGSGGGISIPQRRPNTRTAPAIIDYNGQAEAQRIIEQAAQVEDARFREAAHLGGLVPAVEIPQNIKFTCDNSSETTATTFSFFDAIGAIASINSTFSGYTAATPSRLSMTILNKYIAGKPYIAFRGFRMETSGTSAQYSNDVTFYTYSLGGHVHEAPVSLEDSIAGDKHDETIQYYDIPMVINSLVGLSVSVTAETTLYVTFYPYSKGWKTV